ncbi:DUF389 domain-containing protein [Nocardia harenae]|uniref:DUF389 domain-containing protein n=1 Tax=Nocardia harenae TaxID=358707 RepID=UPI00082BDAE7|nr:DUF389 domain-containing protein [Nocardia harenae]
MLHLRIISPPGSTPDVLATLRADAGVTHLSLLPGAALAPEGDLVQADVAREAANTVLAELERLGLAETGAITLEPIETVLSAAAERAAEAAPGEPADAVVWEELLARTHEESTLSASFVAFLTIACLLAAVGVATDSAVTIVGAMVVGPEFGPLAAFAVGVVRRDRALVRRSALALAAGFPAAMAITLAATLCWEQFGWITLTGFEAARNVDFIYRVGPFSLVVAVLAGAAGMLALCTAKSAALVGVFISVTTVPAAGFAVVASTIGEWHVAIMSIGQLAVNLAGIVVAGVLVLYLGPHEGGGRWRLSRLVRRLR